MEASQKEEEPQIIEGEYIVIFEEQWNREISEQVGRQADQLREEIIQSHQIHADSVMNRYRYAIKGFAAKLSVEQAEELKNDPRIARVTPNALLRLASYSTATVEAETAEGIEIRSVTASSIQSGTWGVSRVGGPLDGIELTAWVLDTGIDLDHPDLNVDVQNSASFIANETANDGNGHGTHVAGIIASTGQNTGIQGVAAGATVVAIKVCNDAGTDCPVNSVLNGIDFISIRAQPNDIVNMSLGGPDPDENLLDIDNAVINAADNGVRFAIAAGNNRIDAADFTPARVVHQNTWTVSAFRQGDEFVQIFDWNTPNCNSSQNPNRGSNFGNPPINFSAPGENILSLWRDGGTLTTCGTSMAAPHVAGLLLTVPDDITADGFVSNDPDGNPDPIAAYAPEPTLEVTISGPTFLETHQMGTWTAHVENASGSVSFQWFYTDSSTSDWIPGGSDSDTFSHAFSETSNTSTDTGVRVDVTSGSEQDTDILYVFVTSEECDPFFEICEN